MSTTRDILTASFFELFDVPVSYDVDLTKVQQCYQLLQSQLHPDKFASAEATQKRLSMQMTSRINEALQTLTDPVLRAAYLLELKGVDINLDNETTVDAEFLMQQLELRESLETIKHNQDGEEALDKLDELSQQVKRQVKKTMQHFSAAYSKVQLDTAREWLRKLQFLQKAEKEIDVLSAQIEDDLMV